MADVIIYGGGLAGTEAALTLARLGVSVDLIEEKCVQPKEVYSSTNLAELVCSNSLKAKRPYVASGILKAELQMLNSTLLPLAYANEVPAGGALAVDRENFSKAATELVAQEPLINLHHAAATHLDGTKYELLATGPLTDADFITALKADLKIEDTDFAAYFFDAQAPLIEADSIDMEQAFYMSRYERGEAAYLNCPLNKEEYQAFYEALVNAELAEVHDFDKKYLFSACMPVERIAQTGERSLLFGPLKPVGIIDPRSGKKPYACVQLRQDNVAKTLFNMVGFQTQLKWPEQARVFRMIPALKNAEFARYGVMHRNTYLHSPRFLQPNLACKYRKTLYFAGQITGLEGYVPAIASGLFAAWQIYLDLKGANSAQAAILPQATMLGSLLHYITAEHKDFQPMTANLGILPELASEYRDKKLKGKAYAQRSLTALSAYLEANIYPVIANEHGDMLAESLAAKRNWLSSLENPVEEQ